MEYHIDITSTQIYFRTNLAFVRIDSPCHASISIACMSLSRFESIRFACFCIEFAVMSHRFRTDSHRLGTHIKPMRIDFLLLSHWYRIAFRRISRSFASIHIDVHRSALIPYRSAHESIRVDSNRFVSSRFTCFRIEFALTTHRARMGFA